MKSRYSFIAGMLTMALLVGMIGPAYAAYRKQATLEYSDIKLTLDGNLVTTQAEPFIIDGVSYLPIRAVGEAMGLKVDWDGSNNTVVLTSTNKNYTDCYKYFSVPTMDNIVDDAWLSGTVNGYFHDMHFMYDGEKVDPLAVLEYFDLLEYYGYEFVPSTEETDDRFTYFSPISNIVVTMWWQEKDDCFHIYVCNDQRASHGA